MIINVVVISALLLGIIYIAIWSTQKHVRERIELPKQRFQEQVNQYDARIMVVESPGNEKQERG